MIELGDTVRMANWRSRIPRQMRGEVVKVNPVFAVVNWLQPQIPLIWWWRGRFWHSNELPTQSRVRKDNLEVLERKPGPW